ncbi:unnamed protein product [Orchesella dallaii]|uniref:Gustatory receptor n=1 Tax=Orchesella dallaii TaxID=48710 RepID=A0ABP1PJI3_9HEXA
MLTNLHVFALRLQKHLFFYMYPYPCRWESSFKKLQVTVPAWKRLPFVLALFMVFFNTLQLVLGAIYFLIIKRQKDYGRFHFFMHTYIAYAFAVWLVIAKTTWQNLTTSIIGINELLEMERELLKRHPIRRCHLAIILSSHQHSAGALLILSIVAAGSPFVVLFIMLSFEYDMLHFILHEILPSPTEWDIKLILFNLCLRAIFLLSVMLELFRTIAFVFALLVICFDSLTTILHILESNLAIPRIFKGGYLHISVIYKSMERIVSVVVYGVVNVGFWFVVLNVWIQIKGFGKVPTLLYVCSISLTIMAVLLVVLFLPRFVAFLDKLSTLPASHVKEMAYLSVRCKWRKDIKIALKRAAALQPIRLKFGPFYTIDENFIMEYMCLLTMRIFDAIFIVDFERPSV